jgi:hypothetical protein
MDETRFLDLEILVRLAFARGFDRFTSTWRNKD